MSNTKFMKRYFFESVFKNITCTVTTSTSIHSRYWDDFGESNFCAEGDKLLICSCFEPLQIMNWRDNLRIPQGARLSEEAENLIRSLICDQGDRLGSNNGAEDLKRHPFFKGCISDCCRRRISLQ